MWDGPDHRIFEGRKKFGNIYTTMLYYWTSLLFLFQDLTLYYYIVYLILSIAAMTIGGPIFLSVLLIDIVHRIPSLTNVIKAVSSNMKNLIMILLLIGIIVYVIAIFGFFYIWDLLITTQILPWNDLNPAENLCLDLYECFV